MPKNFVGFYEHFKENDRIQDVLKSPAFEGKGILLLPWMDVNRYPDEMTIANIGELLLWHTNFNGKEMAEGLNVLIDEVNANEEIFYDIYTEEEKKQDPDKENTSLIFMRGKPNAPFVIIVPGGGGYYVASIHSGFPIGKKFIEKGYNAFVLKYRAGEGMNGELMCVEDIQRAVSFVRTHAQELKVDPDEYALEGESAGGSFVSSAVYGSANNPRSSSLLRPIAVILAYPFFEGKREFEPFDPPAYLVVGKQDHLASWVDAVARFQDMDDAGIAVECHVLENAEHGFGTGKGTDAEGWINEAIHFWEAHLPNPVH